MEVNLISPTVDASLQTASASSARKKDDAFQKALGSAIEEINHLQHKADEAVNRLALGEAIDLHDVTIAVEEAHIAFQLAMQVRNKLVEAYQEVMRMQV